MDEAIRGRVSRQADWMSGHSYQTGSRTALKEGGDENMLHWTLVFLVVALIAALLGFGGIAGAAAGIAKLLFFIFLVIWIVSLVARRSI